VKEEQDDLTLVYMFGFRKGQDSMKDEIARLRAAFRINMLRLNPALRHAEIDALLGESPARGGEKTDD
jgi:hypothetical protein